MSSGASDPLATTYSDAYPIALSRSDMAAIRASRARLNVRYDEGSGPIFVFLHGLAADASAWRPVIDHIGPGYRCIAVDLLGHGDSPSPADIDYTTSDHVAALHATLRTLKIAEKFVLVGNSMGGDIAIRYAATYPDELRRLFLLSTPFQLPASAFSKRSIGSMFAEEVVFGPIWTALSRPKKRRGVLYNAEAGRLEGFAKAFISENLEPRSWEVVNKNLVNTIVDTTLLNDLPKLKMPCVLALGVRDPLIRADHLHALMRLKPDLSVRRFFNWNADHFALERMPGRVANEILQDDVRRLHVSMRSGIGDVALLLHDLENGSERWKPLATAFAMKGEVAAVDLLGFGGSPAPTACAYTLADHVCALLGTIDTLYPGRRVRLVGSGLGATVALACAASRPTSVSSVVAFSPMLAGPRAGEGAKRDSNGQRQHFSALRKTFVDSARRRNQIFWGERMERSLVAPLRSIDSVASVNSLVLLDRVNVPVRFVLPSNDTSSPREWLRSVVGLRPEFALVEPPGPRDLPYSRPAEALAVLGGASEAQIFEAISGRKASRSLRSQAIQEFAGRAVRLVVTGMVLLFGAALFALGSAASLRMAPVLGSGFLLACAAVSIGFGVRAHLLARARIEQLLAE